MERPPTYTLHGYPRRFPTPPGSKTPGLPLGTATSSIYYGDYSAFFDSGANSEFGTVSQTSSVRIVPTDLSEVLSDSDILWYLFVVLPGSVVTVLYP